MYLHNILLQGSLKAIQSLLVVPCHCVQGEEVYTLSSFRFRIQESLKDFRYWASSHIDLIVQTLAIHHYTVEFCKQSLGDIRINNAVVRRTTLSNVVEKLTKLLRRLNLDWLDSSLFSSLMGAHLVLQIESLKLLHEYIGAMHQKLIWKSLLRRIISGQKSFWDLVAIRYEL